MAQRLQGQKMGDYSVRWTVADQKHQPGLPLSGITAEECAGNVTLWKIMSGRLWLSL